MRCPLGARALAVASRILKEPVVSGNVRGGDIDGFGAHTARIVTPDRVYVFRWTSKEKKPLAWKPLVEVNGSKVSHVFEPWNEVAQ